MAEELQHLIDRIRRDGLDKARAEAERVVAEARRQATEIVGEAETRAAVIVAEAEEKAGLSAQRGEAALRQAARDVVLSVGAAVSRLMDGLIGRAVERGLTDDVLKDLIRAAVKRYCGEEGAESSRLLLSEEQQARLGEFAATELKQAVAGGLEIAADKSVAHGFRLSLADGRVTHDFTADAVADALANLLRPGLAAAVREALAGNRNGS